jgi:hypothetical protein
MLPFQWKTEAHAISLARLTFAHHANGSDPFANGRYKMTCPSMGIAVLQCLALFKSFDFQHQGRRGYPPLMGQQKSKKKMKIVKINMLFLRPQNLVIWQRNCRWCAIELASCSASLPFVYAYTATLVLMVCNLCSSIHVLVLGSAELWELTALSFEF